jgi:glycine cleavage system H lipoate-binding protein
VKAASDVISPVSGNVVEANDAVVDDSSILNTAPDSEGKQTNNQEDVLFSHIFPGRLVIPCQVI